MPGVARLGDILGPGGVLTAPVFPDVTVNGRPVAVLGTAYSPHFCCGAKGCPPTHCFGTVIMGDFNVTVHGVPVAYKGAPGLCGHSIMTASSDVQVGGAGLVGTAVGFAAGGFNKDLGDLGTQGAFGGVFADPGIADVAKYAQAGFSLASGDVMGAAAPFIKAGIDSGVKIGTEAINNALGDSFSVTTSQVAGAVQAGFSLANGDVMGAVSPVIKAGVDSGVRIGTEAVRGAIRGSGS